MGSQQGELSFFYERVTDITTGTAKAVFAPTVPSKLLRITVIPYVSVSASHTAKFRMRHYGSGRTALDPTGLSHLGRISLASADLADLSGVYANIISNISNQPPVIFPGETVEIDIDDSTYTSGQVIVGLQYEPGAFVDVRGRTDVLTPGYVTNQSTLNAMTEETVIY